MASSIPFVKPARVGNFKLWRSRYTTMPKSGGVGYVGLYTNPSDGKDYKFMMTYFKSLNAAVEFRLETTEDTFNEMEFEFEDILNSIK